MHDNLPAWLTMVLFKKNAFQILTALISGLVMTNAIAAKDVTSLPEYTMRTSLFEKLREHREIVMLGDSLTARGEWGEFYPGASIANRGIGGDTTAGMLLRLDPIIAMKPKVVFLLAGINDLGARRDVPEILITYQKIVEALTDSGSNVFVQSTLYVSRRSRVSNNVDIARINAGMKAYCLAGKKCQFIDLNTSMSPKGRLDRDYTGDGIHLNGKGYSAWVKAISTAMAEYLPPKTRH